MYHSVRLPKRPDEVEIQIQMLCIPAPMWPFNSHARLAACQTFMGKATPVLQVIED